MWENGRLLRPSTSRERRIEPIKQKSGVDVVWGEYRKEELLYPPKLFAQPKPNIVLGLLEFCASQGPLKWKKRADVILKEENVALKPGNPEVS